MSAYLLILLAVLSRIAVLPHLPWLNFTAVGGSLIFFGARRPLRQAILPVALLAATDYYLTVYAYNYPVPRLGVPDYMGVVCGGHRSGASAAGEAGLGRTRGSRGADCADIVLPDYEFRGVGGLADVSADLYGTGRCRMLPGCRFTGTT